jgi:hypothetical protein
MTLNGHPTLPLASENPDTKVSLMWNRVLQRAFGRLEPDEGKLSRPFLRGGGCGNTASLPDQGMMGKKNKKRALLSKPA